MKIDSRIKKLIQPTRLALFIAVAGMLVTFTGCATHPPVLDKSFDISHGGVNLHIPDRGWDPKTADFDAGWCGEASIQMALAFYGKEFPQEQIHRAGHPAHSDLEDDDMVPALKTLGANFTRFDVNDIDEADFVAWIQQQLQNGHPVICGCKIFPTDHPAWNLDHFVVVSGYNSKGLLMNTQLDMDGQVLVSYEQLNSKHEGYGFRNPSHHFWGVVVTGVN